MWVVYLIVSKHPHLPPFYIGSTSKWRWENTFYCGTPRSVEWEEKWKKAVSEEPHLFTRVLFNDAEFQERQGALDFEYDMIKRFKAHRSEFFANKLLWRSDKVSFGCGPRASSTRTKIGNFWRGKKQPQSQVDKRVASNTGKKRSDEAKANMSSSHNETRSYENLKKTRKAVSPDGVIHEFKGIVAFAKANGLSPGNFSSMLKGNLEIVKGWTRFIPPESS